ncbi:MAG: GNAT family N-acetyltransferase [Sphingobacteriia bacterium]|nr:GNAT family N-acetyltransferase [Sphingobacteriia bacterium]
MTTIPQTLKTERLILELLKRSDAVDIHTNIDENIVKNIGGGAPWPYTKHDADNFIKICQDNLKNNLCYDYVIRNYKTVFIGIISFYTNGMLGYWIAGKHQRNGFAFEALISIENVAKRLEFKELWATVKPNNTPSINLLKKFGMIMTNEVSEDNEIILRKIL